MVTTLPANEELELKVPLDTDRSKVDDSVNAAPSYFRTSKGDVFEYRNCVTEEEIEDTFCTIRLKTHQLGLLKRRPAIRVSFKFTFHPAVPRCHRFRNAIISVNLAPKDPNGASPEVSAFSPQMCFGSPSPRRQSFHQMEFDIVNHTWQKGCQATRMQDVQGTHEDHFSIAGHGHGDPVNTIVWEMTEDRESEHGCMGLPRVMETAAVISYQGPFTISFKISSDIGWEWGRSQWVPNCWPLVGKLDDAVDVDPSVLEENEEEFDRLLQGGLIRHTSFGEKTPFQTMVRAMPVN